MVHWTLSPPHVGRAPEASDSMNDAIPDESSWSPSLFVDLLSVLINYRWFSLHSKRAVAKGTIPCKTLDDGTFFASIQHLLRPASSGQNWILWWLIIKVSSKDCLFKNERLWIKMRCAHLDSNWDWLEEKKHAGFQNSCYLARQRTVD